MNTNKEINLKSKNLNLKQIADSGQCFRMNEIEAGRYSLIAFGEYLELIQENHDEIRLLGVDEKDLFRWEEYFDISYDYGKTVSQLKAGDDLFLKNAAEFGEGLRILRQDPFEILISFIISQNKNIPAIKSSIEKISAAYGEEKNWNLDTKIKYHTFPSPENLAAVGKEKLRTHGLGYRDDYVYQAALAVAEGRLDLEKLHLLSYEELISVLISLKGVGMKVASCVALFAYSRFNSLPVDVWIARVIDDVYGGDFSWDPYRGREGLIQQYMFYYIRNGYDKK